MSLVAVVTGLKTIRWVPEVQDYVLNKYVLRYPKFPAGEKKCKWEILQKHEISV